MLDKLREEYPLTRWMVIAEVGEDTLLLLCAHCAHQFPVAIVYDNLFFKCQQCHTPGYLPKLLECTMAQHTQVVRDEARDKGVVFAGDVAIDAIEHKFNRWLKALAMDIPEVV